MAKRKYVTSKVLTKSAFVLLLLGPLAGATMASAPIQSNCKAALTNECLAAMLTDMGYNPKALSKGYLIIIKQGTWTINMQLVISLDGKRLGMNANLGTVTEESMTADQWKALLISNGNIEPISFYYEPDRKKLYLHRSDINQHLTTEIVSNEISNFAETVKATQNIWGFTH